MDKNTTYSELDELDFPSDEDEKLWGVKMVRKETMIIKLNYYG